MTPPILLTVELAEHEAWALAQYLKRAGFSDYRALATSEAEAWMMLAAGERLRKALAEQGCAPR